MSSPDPAQTPGQLAAAAGIAAAKAAADLAEAFKPRPIINISNVSCHRDAEPRDNEPVRLQIMLNGKVWVDSLVTDLDLSITGAAAIPRINLSAVAK